MSNRYHNSNTHTHTHTHTHTETDLLESSVEPLAGRSLHCLIRHTTTTSSSSNRRGILLHLCQLAVQRLDKLVLSTGWAGHRLPDRGSHGRAVDQPTGRGGSQLGMDGVDVRVAAAATGGPLGRSRSGCGGGYGDGRRRRLLVLSDGQR